MNSKIVLDLSHWNNIVDWKKVKNSGVWGVILKVGGTGTTSGKPYKDVNFEENYRKAKEVGLNVGAYWYASKFCNSIESGILEANYFLDHLVNKQFELPVYIDYEEGDKKNKEGNTSAIYSFCEYIERHNYFVGIYGSEISCFKERFNKDRLERFTWWVANYSKVPQIAHPMWQYTSKGNVKGINGLVDVNNCYIDFPKIIKAKGLNGYGK